MDEEYVHFRCVKEGSRLRVKIISSGYNHDANCQFPKKIRVEGREFTAPKDDVTFTRGSRGTLWYKVRKASIVILSNTQKIFEVDDEPECCICFDEIKRIVFIPCGHFCICNSCAKHINDKCPICRTDIIDTVDID